MDPATRVVANGTASGHKAGRVVYALALSGLMTSATIALTSTLIPLRLNAQGIAAAWIGLNHSSSAIVSLVGMPIMLAILTKLGPRSTIIVGSGTAAVAIVVMGVSAGPAATFALRPVMGAALVFAWLARDVWINTTAEDAERGRSFGRVTLFGAAAQALGPLTLCLVGVEGVLPFLVAAFVALLAAAPVIGLSGQSIVATARRPERLALAAFVSQSPGLAWGAVVYGGLFAVSLALMPVALADFGLSIREIAVVMATMAAGRALLAVLAGAISDRAGRIGTFRSCAALAATTVLLLPPAETQGVVAVAIVTFFFGGGLGGLQVTAQALLGESFIKQRVPAATAAFMLLFQAGAVIFPFVSGWIMSGAGIASFVAALALLAASSILFAPRLSKSSH